MTDDWSSETFREKETVCLNGMLLTCRCVLVGDFKIFFYALACLFFAKASKGMFLMYKMKVIFYQVPQYLKLFKNLCSCKKPVRSILTEVVCL